METTNLTSMEMKIIGLGDISLEAAQLLDTANTLAEILGHNFTVNELSDLFGIYEGHDYCIGILDKQFFIIDAYTLDTANEDIEKCDSFVTVIDTALDWVYSLQELLSDNMDISEDLKAEESAELDRIENVFDSMKAAIQNIVSI